MLISQIRSGNTLITSGDESVELTPTEVDEAVATMSGTEKIAYEVHADDSHGRGTITVPSWCSGDPAMAVALYLFGERTAVRFVTKAEVL